MEWNKKHKLFFADSRKIDSIVEPDSVDLIVTGPPYFNEVIYSNDAGQLSAETDYRKFLIDIEQVWRSCKATLKEGGIVALWVHDFFRGEHSPRYIPFHADILSTLEPHFNLKNIIVWDRYLHRDKGPIPHERPLGTQLQYILILQKTGSMQVHRAFIERSLARFFWEPVWSKKTHPMLLGSHWLFALAHSMRKFIPRIFARLQKIFSRSKFVSDAHAFTVYTTECPEEVAQKLILDFSKPGDVILDPFLGSGTTMRVADRLARHCVGVEINPKALSAILSKVNEDTIDIVLKK